MKKLIISMLFLSLLIGCQETKESDRLQIVTTLFPQYDQIRSLVDDKADVTLLLPPGVEAHTYEPTPKDIVKINKSDLFIYTSDNFEVYAKKIVESLDDKNLKVIELLSDLDLEDSFDDGHEDDHDPHFWLDPSLMKDMSLLLSKTLSELDPSNADTYTKNSEQLNKSYLKLDQDFKDLFEHSDSRPIIFAGHFAFGYFADKYGLKYLSPFENLNTNSEPSIKKIKSLVDYINDESVQVIYFEELVDPKLARTLSNETGVKTLMLHAAHNISKAELRSGTTYFDIMEENLENLKVGLNDE